MESLNVAAISVPPTSRASESSTFRSDVADEQVSGRVRAALVLLLEAYQYAQDLDANRWDFATEIGSLRRLKLSNSDLRWLAGRGLIEHGVEVTLASDEERTFQRPSRLIFSRRTCFVLSPAGAELAHAVLRDSGPSPGEARRAENPPALSIARPPNGVCPKWDRDRQELRLGATVLRQFKIPSIDEETILAAFEELNWPQRIDDPLPPAEVSEAKWRLQETIEALNRHLRQPLLRFRGDSTGRSVHCEYGASGDARG